MIRSKNDMGVSVIVGTLLLILITVTAAAGLALMISQMQKDEMNRQSHLAAVAAENITILNVAFENNQTEWNLTGIQNSQNWSSVRLTLVNLNTANAIIMGIAINDHYAVNFTDKSRTDPSVSSRNIYNSTNYLTIPATGSKDVYIDFVANATDDPTELIDYSEAQYFPINNLLNIKILTSLTNFFETILKPPNPIFQTSTDTENLGPIQRTVLVLDGSESTADNMVVDWNWTINSSAFTWPNPGNWTDFSNQNMSFSEGKITHITPLNAGPFSIILKVTDNVGMTGVSEPEVVPADQNYVPIVNLNPQPFCIYSIPGSNQTGVLVKMVNINGNPPVKPITVNFAVGSNPYNTNFEFSNYSSETDPTGTAWTNITSGNGTINVIYGTFPAIQVPVKGPMDPC
jgi:hypothetical protein